MITGLEQIIRCPTSRLSSIATRGCKEDVSTRYVPQGGMRLVPPRPDNQ